MKDTPDPEDDNVGKQPLWQCLSCKIWVKSQYLREAESHPLWLMFPLRILATEAEREHFVSLKP